MRGQHLIIVEHGNSLERREVVADRVGSAEGIERDMRRDVWQHVVPAEQKLLFVIDEADVSRRVTRGEACSDRCGTWECIAIRQ